MPENKIRENMCPVSSDSDPIINTPDLEISSYEVDELVSDIKENLRLSTSSTKSRPCISRISSRASPYRIPAKCSENCNREGKSPCLDCLNKNPKYGRPGLHETDEDDPYELLQKLLKEGGLIQEAVRRVQLESAPKQKTYYDSDEYDDNEDDAAAAAATCSPANHMFSNKESNPNESAKHN